MGGMLLLGLASIVVTITLWENMDIRGLALVGGGVIIVTVMAQKTISTPTRFGLYTAGLISIAQSGILDLESPPLPPVPQLHWSEIIHYWPVFGLPFLVYLITWGVGRKLEKRRSR